LEAKERLRALLDSGPRGRGPTALVARWRVYAGDRDVGQALLPEGYVLRPRSVLCRVAARHYGIVTA
jgi:hypothetical protein